MRYLLSFTALVATLGVAGCQTAPTRRTDSAVVVAEKGVSEIAPEEARPAVEAAYSQFIDVRSPEEYAAGHAYRARNIPLDQLTANLDKLERNEPVYLICQSGRRSKEAAGVLSQNGFNSVFNISGGTNEWSARGLPMETVLR